MDKSYKSIKAMMRDLNKDKREHPIRYALSCIIPRTQGYLEDKVREIKAFFQRGKRGYADCDVWNFDGYLCDVIIGGLKQLRKYKSGIPTELYDKYKPDEKAAHQEWNRRLDQMIEGFIAGRKIIDLNYNWKNPKTGALLRLKYNRGMELFKEHFFNLWD